MLDSYNNSVKCKKRKEDEYEKMEKVNQQQMFLKMVPNMRQEVSQEIKYLMRITVEMSLEQES